jgi:hypothetical protein
MLTRMCSIDRRRSKRTAMLAGLAVAAVAGLLLGAKPASATPLYYVANLTPLNNSGVYATINLTLDGNLLTVTEHATGLQPNVPHPQHIHGLLGAAAPMTALPTAASDTDRDGFIELAEGQVSYGPILLDLSSPPGGALADFPTAPGGVIDFSETYNLTDSTIFDAGFSGADLLPLTNREIVIHGMTVAAGIGAGTPGEVDGTGGYLATLPVSDGLIRAVPAPEPASIALLITGLVGVLAPHARRRMRAG